MKYIKYFENIELGDGYQIDDNCFSI